MIDRTVMSACADELTKIKSAAGGANIASLLAKRIGQPGTMGAPMQAQRLLQAGNPNGARILHNIRKQFPAGAGAAAAGAAQAV